jgi:hypothetical protein
VLSRIFDNSHKGRNVWSKETICELHREIYDLLVLGLHKSNPALLAKLIPILERAYVCGIKMNRKMVEAKCQIKGWEEHLDKDEVIRLRILRRELTKELERIRETRNSVRQAVS